MDWFSSFPTRLWGSEGTEFSHPQRFQNQKYASQPPASISEIQSTPKPLSAGLLPLPFSLKHRLDLQDRHFLILANLREHAKLQTSSTFYQFLISIHFQQPHQNSGQTGLQPNPEKTCPQNLPSHLPFPFQLLVP